MGNAKILLVEDDRLQGKVAVEFLEKSGYEVIWVQDGKSAIKAAKTQPVDIIILDLVLPDITGIEVSRWLKFNEDTKGIPIIMLTAKSEMTDKVAGLEAGADDYLPKPFNEIELNARIYASLRTKSLRDELKKKNHQLENLLGQVENLANTDMLTGLWNRRRLEAVLMNEFRRTKRYQTPLSCMMIDIDHFKRINDIYGHATGDIVLKETADIILSMSRTVDTVARWGGEEFIALLPQTGKNDAVMPADRIRKAIEEKKFTGIPNETITISIGIASAPDFAIDNEDKLVSQADVALYRAKENGRNRVEVA